MAAFDTTPVRRSSLMANAFSFFARFNAALKEQAMYLKTVRELEQLSDRELSDIGLGRSDIHDAARATALQG